MDVFDIAQICGAIILSMGYMPQIVQIIKTKSVKDINGNTLLMTFVGIVLFQMYAVHLMLEGKGTLLAGTNSLSLLLSGTMVALKTIYNQKRRGIKNENIKMG